MEDAVVLRHRGDDSGSAFVAQHRDGTGGAIVALYHDMERHGTLFSDEVLL